LRPDAAFLDVHAGAVAEGGRLGQAGAVGYALRSRGRRDRPKAGWDSLTPAEREVAALAAQGRSNLEIGASLLVSTATVRTHLSSIYAKLGLTNRAELAAAAAGRDL
jgi:DNA-binding CsgD family transcriptional regulator